MSGEEDLTPTEQRMFDAIGQWFVDHDYSPSYRDLAERVGVSSISSVARTLNLLREKGYVDWSEKAKRTLRLLK